MLFPLWLLACAPDPCTGYIDADGDGFGEEDARFDCGARAVAVGGDCDDADAGVFPGAIEACNEKDDDCDAHVDEDAADGVSTWVDADEDGYPPARAWLARPAPGATPPSRVTWGSTARCWTRAATSSATPPLPTPARAPNSVLSRRARPVLAGSGCVGDPW